MGEVDFRISCAVVLMEVTSSADDGDTAVARKMSMVDKKQFMMMMRNGLTVYMLSVLKNRTILQSESSSSDRRC